MPTKKDNPFNDMDEKEEIPEPFLKALIEIVENKITSEPLKRFGKVIQKPLPQIIDELDDNIRTVFEVAHKAEEAARAAKEAAYAGIRASQEVEKLAEEAREAGQMAAEKATKAAAEAARKAEKLILKYAKEITEVKTIVRDIQEREALLLSRIEILEKKPKKLEKIDRVHDKEFEYDKVNQILSMTGKNDLVLEQIWDNHKDAAYDTL